MEVMEVASKLAAGICMKIPPSLVLETFYVLFGATESRSILPNGKMFESWNLLGYSAGVVRMIQIKKYDLTHWENII